MLARSEVSPEKLRGGFYTPPALVRATLDALARVAPDGPLRVLEPSAGDGAFLRGLAAHPLGERVAATRAIELVETEAARCGALVADAVEWCAETGETFDAAVGNPPFVRFQFAGGTDQADRLGERIGVSFGAVGNLWIPVLLGALSRLRSGGGFAFVVPAECLTGVSAAVVRRFLLDRCRDVALEFYAFPGVLQEVVILSGRAAPGPSVVSVGGRRHAVHGDGPWTRYLLSRAQIGALSAAEAISRPLGDVARFEVSIVTGANRFFCPGRETVERYGLGPWARPLLSRARHAPGLVAEPDAYLLDFSPGRETPPREYLEIGERAGLAARYKCRIREPWWRVPGVQAGSLLLSKRSHLAPRVLVNPSGVLTTDTIYRGRTLTPGVGPRDVAAGFHSSLTLLSAELEGRSFGGGVLELVPSEITRLRFVAGAGAELPRLDAILRAEGIEALVEATDALLVRRAGVAADLLGELAGARAELLERRLARNRRGGVAAAAAGQAALPAVDAA